MQTRLIDEMCSIDVTLSFADDTPGYWDCLKTSDLLRGGGGGEGSRHIQSDVEEVSQDTLEQRIAEWGIHGP